MSEIDWSKAPEDAEIYLPNQAGTAECFAMFRDSEAYYAYPGMTKWVRWGAESKDDIIHSFRHSPKKWTGEGLPPAGTTCEWKEKTGFQWVKATVLFITDSSVVMRREDGFEWQMMTARTVFRPFRTPEQIAAEAKTKVVDLMAADLDIPRAIAARAHDLGYRKFEITDDSDPA